MTLIKAIYFDLGGVILRTTDKSHRAALGAEFGLSYEQMEQVVFGGGPFGTAARATLGAITEQAHWLAVTRRLGLNPNQSQRINDQFFAGDTVDWQIVDLLRGLRGRFKVGLISNAWDGLRPWILREKFNDAFDTMIISAEVRMAKPLPAIYKHALNAFLVKPEEAVFVDDFIENIHACNALGMRGIHFRSPEQALAELEDLLNSKLYVS